MIKSTYSSIVIALLACCSFATDLPVAATRLNPINYKQSIRVVCVDDSITAGIGAAEGKSWRRHPNQKS